ncbi:MAG: sulfide/dihydroorotate dehydrogenase-like FAD/NAD-binding protein, partial [Marinilabilia sp.]
MKEAGNRTITAIEARSEYLLYNEERLKNYSDRFIITTSDGSRGEKGKVKSMFNALIESGEKIDMAYFMGCTFMMMIS